MHDLDPPRHRVAIIGLGMAAPPHARALLDLAERVSIAAAYSPTPERRAAFAAQYPVPLVDKLEPILADRSIDTVAILTPPATHRELVARCAAAGKQILIEKPLDVAYEPAAEIVDIAASAQVRLAVGLQHRFHPAVRELARLVQSGALGTIANAAVSVRWWRPQSYYDEPGRGTLARDGGGVLLTQAIHALDVFVGLVPRIKELAAFAATTPLHRMETEDAVAAALRFDNGAIGSLDATTAAFPGAAERIELVGTLGTAVYSAGMLDVHYQTGERSSVGERVPTGGGANPMAFSHAAHRAMWREFFDALHEHREPLHSAASALAVHLLIDGLLESAQRGIALTLPDLPRRYARAA